MTHRENACRSWPLVLTRQDEQQLRGCAEGALADSEPTWTYVGGPLAGDVHVQTRPRNPGRSKIRFDPNAVRPFVAAASPGVVIALLDEIAHLREQVESHEAARRVVERERDAWERAYLRTAAMIPSTKERAEP